MTNAQVNMKALSNISAGILITDSDHNITWLNSFEEKFYQSTSDKLLGRSVIDCHKEENKGKIQSFLEKFKTGELKEFTKIVDGIAITYSSYYQDEKYSGVVRVRIKLPTQI